ncbi:hypothetical protein COV61_00560 [Candidatus Micrarchaeota archaeon CG11_big_fil_rev_8_21_14_0_20_47_5]|nr:MAG: hypothetical protein AUJ17_00155 [Candidatus Micrarchaeota archaeon CG1_02_47_40]PIN84280.1 MAG: hypothetical protein COV61_00560 [Candidatus Micrarchaeota archaeon CG11_big_fil_rev_8_21_14_0_20_47_5]
MAKEKREKKKMKKKQKISIGEISFPSAKELKEEGKKRSKQKKSPDERMLDELFSERKKISY